jgi:predicted patatin/cPLA2 family phospholipase
MRFPKPKNIPLIKSEAFVVPEVYRPIDHPEYRPAWQGATTVPCTLVLEGGAMRGQFTAGVLDLLMDEQLLPSTAVGVSAGALNGLNYVAGLRGRSCYLNTKYSDDWRYFSMRSFVRTGNAFNPEFVFGAIPYELEPFDFDAYAASPLTLYTVASNLENGQADYHLLRDARDDMDYLQASAAMPLLSQIVEVDGKKLLDGGICDSVPLEFSQSLEAQRQIVVLTQDASYIKPPNKAIKVVERAYHDYPQFVDSVRDRHIRYNRVYDQLPKLHAAGQIFLIRPQQPVAISSMEHDRRKLYQLYIDGYDEAKKQLAALAAYLGL